MKRLAATVMSLSLLASACAPPNQAKAVSASAAPSIASSQGSPTITIARSGAQPSRQGPAENFTGSVRIDPLFDAKDPSRTTGGRVTFEPGARTAWHTHPLGQTLIVTAGTGWVQQWGGQIQEMRQGDIVRIPPGQKHWHGATATTPGPLSTGSQPGNRQRPDRDESSRPASISPRQSARTRRDAGGVDRDHHPLGVLRGLAQRVDRDFRGQGRLREEVTELRRSARRSA